MIALPAKPVRSREHLGFIRSLPCLCCGRDRRIEAAHVGRRGMSQKSSDLDTVPLCVTHHKEQHRVGLKAFCSDYELNLGYWIVRFTLKPKITVWEGRYIGHWANEVFVLTLAEFGITSAFIACQSQVREVLVQEIRDHVARFHRRD